MYRYGIFQFVVMSVFNCMLKKQVILNPPCTTLRTPPVVINWLSHIALHTYAHQYYALRKQRRWKMEVDEWPRIGISNGGSYGELVRSEPQGEGFFDGINSWKDIHSGKNCAYG